MSLKKVLIIGLVVVFSLVLVFNVFSGDSSDSTSSASEETASEEKYLGTEIVFFWLPTGTPCQQQDKILQAMEEGNSNLEVTRVDVNDPNNSALANKYGIRSVPSVVVLDKEGKTVKQFAPGIQPESTLKKYLD